MRPPAIDELPHVGRQVAQQRRPEIGRRPPASPVLNEAAMTAPVLRHGDEVERMAIGAPVTPASPEISTV